MSGNARTDASPLSAAVPGVRRPWQKWFLIGSAVLFAGWIAWLVFLAATTTRPIVLSRPQFLISTLDVIAEVDRPEGDQATVREVHGPTTEEDKKLVGQTVAVVNLAECEGWSGPGLYILPLMSDGKGHYMVAHTPPSPGFEPNPFTRAGRPHIYPVTRETRQQLDQIQKPQP